MVSFSVCNACNISKCVIEISLAGFSLCSDFCPPAAQIILHINAIACRVLCMDKVPFYIISIALLYDAVCPDDCEHPALCVIGVLYAFSILSCPGIFLWANHLYQLPIRIVKLPCNASITFRAFYLTVHEMVPNLYSSLNCKIKF